jgi:general secretion pathway protein E
MARLNIAEKRLPQDGRMEVKLGNRLVDLRVSLLPTAFGERVVLRLLEKTAKLLDLDELGLNRDNLIHLKQFLNLSHGIILVTGPTGSGKTTSLYAALSHINAPDKNILTIEDPIEYQIEGIGQMQVNPKIGLTFASGLRSIVRQDPDVILIGEIRDLETAEIAIQAALTGHLVLSTLHTNDAPSAVTRLIKMGIEPFLISSAVRAIIAQRLVRRICPECRAQYTPPDRAQAEKEFAHFALDGELTKPLGCDACFGTGYRGRTALFEFMRMTEKLQDFILTTSDANQIRSLAMAEGMTSLRQDGVEKVIGGVTTTDEVLKATLI